MKSFIKELRNHRLKTHLLIRSWLQPKLGAVGIRYRLPAKIRLANRWAGKHPKRTFACVAGSLLFLLAGNIALDMAKANRTDRFGELNELNEPAVSTITHMEPLFDGFRTIQANKDIHRQTLLELAGKGQALRKELDSLIAIPKKTKVDSMRIVRNYGQLERIVNSLKNNDNDEN